MPVQNHSGRLSLRNLRPRTKGDWGQIRSLGIYLLITAVSVAALFVMKQAYRDEVLQTWQSASATVEDTRTSVAVMTESSRGGATLYDVQVLVQYQVDGAWRERWITVQQRPEQLADAQLQAFRWKGKTCLVRWNPVNSAQVIAELS